MSRSQSWDTHPVFRGLAGVKGTWQGFLVRCPFADLSQWPPQSWVFRDRLDQTLLYPGRRAADLAFLSPLVLDRHRAVLSAMAGGGDRPGGHSSSLALLCRCLLPLSVRLRQRQGPQREALQDPQAGQRRLLHHLSHPVQQSAAARSLLLQ